MGRLIGSTSGFFNWTIELWPFPMKKIRSSLRLKDFFSRNWSAAPLSFIQLPEKSLIFIPFIDWRSAKQIAFSQAGNMIWRSLLDCFRRRGEIGHPIYFVFLPLQSIRKSKLFRSKGWIPLSWKLFLVLIFSISQLLSKGIFSKHKACGTFSSPFLKMHWIFAWNFFRCCNENPQELYNTTWYTFKGRVTLVKSNL